MAADTPTSAIEGARFCALMNCRYHADREAFLDKTHRWLMFGVVALGASALVDQLPAQLRIAASATTALIGAFDLVFNLSVRARNHAFLRKQYFEVAAALERPNADAPEANYKMMLLSADEEPIYYAGHAVAQNWASAAVYGGEASLPCKVPFLARQFRNFRHFPDRNFNA